MKFYGGKIFGANAPETITGTATNNVVRIATDGQGLVDTGELTIGALQSNTDNYYLTYNSLAYQGIVFAADPAWAVNFIYSTENGQLTNVQLVGASYYLRCTMGASLPRGRGLFHYRAAFVWTTDGNADTFPTITMTFPTIVTNTALFSLVAVSLNTRYPVEYSHTIVEAYDRMIDASAVTNPNGTSFSVEVVSVSGSLFNLNNNIYTVSGCIPVGWVQG